MNKCEYRGPDLQHSGETVVDDVTQDQEHTVNFCSLVYEDMCIMMLVCECSIITECSAKDLWNVHMHKKSF